MAGKIKAMIDTIIEQRTKDNTALIGLTKAKLIMKGIFPDKYTSTSEDDPEIIQKLNNLANELNIKL